MTPAGVVAGRMLAAFDVTDRAEAREILIAWTKVPPLSANDVREILAGYAAAPAEMTDDDLRDTHQAVPNGDQHEGWSVGDRVRNGTDLPDDSQGWISGPMGGEVE